MGKFRVPLGELFSLSPLVVAGVVGVLLGVVELGLFLELPLVIFVAIYIVWITSNYYFEIVEFKALGNTEWPVFSLETLVAGRNQIGVVFFALVLAATGGYVALRQAGMAGLALLWLCAGLVFLPGSVALLATTRRLPAALNPLSVLAAATGMGARYLSCLIVAAGALWLVDRAQARGGIWYFPLVYGLFVQAYLIGDSVYARRLSLGLEVPRSPEAKAAKARTETIAVRKGILTHAYGFATRGNRAGALRHIEGYIASDEDTLEARLWFLQEIARWDAGDLALEFGRRVIDYCERYGFAEPSLSWLS